MGLGVSLSNALSGMSTTQKGLEVLSRNVANQGTPGYHRQSINLVDDASNGSSFARLAGVERAFNEALQLNYNKELSAYGAAKTEASFLARVETYLSKPGSVNSLDTLYGNFENALEKLATSPDDYTTRAEVTSSAELLANTLNGLTEEIQTLREDTETQLASNVSELNRMLSALENVNERLTDQTGDESARMGLLDERDRLVGQISEIVDTRVEYRPDDTVALMTNAGLSLIDVQATSFNFQGVGGLTANSTFSIVDSESGVGTLTARSPSGLITDVVEQRALRSGVIGSLVNLRDETLVELQEQLDEIAASLAQSLSTISTDGTVVTGPPDGFSIETSGMLDGNDFTLTYTSSGTEETVRVVRVDDTDNLPMDTTGPNGERLIGLDFSGGTAAVAAALDTALGAAVTVSNPSGTVLQFDDGGVVTTSVDSLVGRTTVSADQGAGLALNLFVDSNDASFTNNLSGDTQKTGFAGRISVNSAIMTDNTLLVKSTATTSLGNADRANHLLTQLQDTSYTAANVSTTGSGSFRMVGNAKDLVAQMLNFQGAAITGSNGRESSAELAYEAISSRIESEYEVNIDEEMARLMELQNAYSASARVVSTVQELLDALMNI